MLSPMRSLWPVLGHSHDPRLYQITVLSGLCLYGVFWLDFALSALSALVLLSTVLLTQGLCQHLWQRSARYDPYSALISGLSLCLLVRTPSLLLLCATAVVTILSKFTLRWRGKHLFNPTNIALVVMLSTGQVWVSAGQWGNTAFFAFLLACCGGLVVYRAARSDVTYAFLSAHIILRFGRAWWLGDPWSIPIHQLHNGALVLFAFFMISDPKTTPDSRLGRVIFAVLVACLAWYLQFQLYWSNALLWALAGGALCVPCLDWCCPGTRYTWRLSYPQRLPSSLAPRALNRRVRAGEDP